MTEASDGRGQRPPRPSPHSFAARHVALSLWAVLLAPACQVAFGDFEIDGSRLVVSCQPNSTRCYGAKIQRCLGGSEWTDEGTPCASADLCNLAALACTPCQPGEYQCSETQLQLCGDDLKWKAKEICATAALCSVTADRRAGMCVEPGCPVSGQHQCVGNRLQRCALDQSRWDDVELCASASLCDAAAADAQVGAGEYATCRLPACNAGQFNCETGSPRPCNAERKGWDPAMKDCATAGASCNVATGDCSPCVAGEAHCSGPTLQLCNAQLVFTPLQTCQSAAACNADTRSCDDPICVPGEVRCGEFADLQRCRGDGIDWTSEQCSSNALCNPKATRCEPPACRPDSRRCEGNAWQHCRGNLTGWDSVAACAADQSCDPNVGCVPAMVCSEGLARCNNDGLERCMNGTWVHQERCLTHELCNAGTGTCAPPVCGVGERRCLGKDTQSCEDGRHAFKAAVTCGGTKVCNNETKRCEEQ